MTKPALRVIQGGFSSQVQTVRKQTTRFFLSEEEAQIIDKLRYEQDDYIDWDKCFDSHMYIKTKEKGLLTEYYLTEEEYLLLIQRKAFLD